MWLRRRQTIVNIRCVATECCLGLDNLNNKQGCSYVGKHYQNSSFLGFILIAGAPAGNGSRNLASGTVLSWANICIPSCAACMPRLHQVGAWFSSTDCSAGFTSCAVVFLLDYKLQGLTCSWISSANTDNSHKRYAHTIYLNVVCAWFNQISCNTSDKKAELWTSLSP